MADFDRGTRDYSSLYRLYMKCTRECQIAYILLIFGTVVENDIQFGLARAIYKSDELNLTIYGLMKRKTSYWLMTYAKRTSQGTSQDTR